MDNNQKILIGLVVILIISAVAYFLSSTNPQTKDEENKVIFYWGVGCPHCENIKEYIKENQIDKKILIEEREVYNDKKNLEMLRMDAQRCGLGSSMIGIPFLVYKQKCYVGEDEAKNLFDNILKVNG